MEWINEIIGNGQEIVAGMIAAAGVLATWISTKLEWWKEQPKGAQVAYAVGAFLLVAIVATLINSALT